MLVNGLGALCTGVTVLVVVFTKFTEGAWITVVLMPAIMVLMYAIRRHYDKVNREIADPAPLNIRKVEPPIVVIPMVSLNKVVRQALEFALDLSPDVHVLHVMCERDKEALLAELEADRGGSAEEGRAAGAADQVSGIALPRS